MNEIEAPCHQVARELLDLDVEVADAAVVVTPRRLNRVLEFGEFALQVEEGRVGLEVRITFGQCEQRLERATQQVLALSLGLLPWLPMAAPRARMTVSRVSRSWPI